jgi:hypothetical protein
MLHLHSQQPPVVHGALSSSSVWLASCNESDSVCAKLVLGLGAREWQWTAPEVQLDFRCDTRSDMYSYGIVLSEILMGTGDLPFCEFKDMAVSVLKLRIREQSLRPTLAGGVPAWFDGMVRRAWAGEASSRPTFFECVRLLKHEPVASALNPALFPRSAVWLGQVAEQFDSNHVSCLALSNGLMWVGLAGGSNAVRAYQTSSAGLESLGELDVRGSVTCLCASGLSCWSGCDDGSAQHHVASDGPKGKARVSLRFFSPRSKPQEPQITTTATLIPPLPSVPIRVVSCLGSDLLVCGDEGGVITVFSQGDGHRLTELDISGARDSPVGGVCEALLSHGHACFVAVGGDLLVVRLRRETGRLIASVFAQEAHAGAVTALLWCGDLWTASRDNIRVWSADTRAMVADITAPGMVRALALVPTAQHGRTVWCGSDGYIYIYSLHAVLVSLVTLPQGCTVSGICCGPHAGEAWVSICSPDGSGSLLRIFLGGSSHQ